MIEFLPENFSPDLVEHLRDTSDERIRFKFRARTNGSKEYTCVFCGAFNRFQITHTTVTHRCTNRNCRRYMGFGDVGYVLPRQGIRISPPDLVIPWNLRESFPEGDLMRWKGRQTVHEVRLVAFYRE